jgi:hypothetical protein
MFFVASDFETFEVPLKTGPECPIAHITLELNSVDAQYPQFPTLQLFPILSKPAVAGIFANSVASFFDGMNQSEYPVEFERLNEFTFAIAPPRHAVLARFVFVSPQPIPT